MYALCKLCILENETKSFWYYFWFSFVKVWLGQNSFDENIQDWYECAGIKNNKWWCQIEVCLYFRYYGTGKSHQPVLITVTQFGDSSEQKQSNADLDTDPNKYCLQRSTTDSRISYTPTGSP